METVKLEKGQYLVKKGDMKKAMYIIIQGSLYMRTRNDLFSLKSGCIVGLVESTCVSYNCDYYAKEDAVLVAFPFQYVEDYKQIFASQPKYSYAFVHAALNQCGELVNLYEKIHKQVRNFYDYYESLYHAYHEVCTVYGIQRTDKSFEDAVRAISLQDEIEPWEIEYYKSFAKKDGKMIRGMYENDENLCIGEIQKASRVMNQIILVMQEMMEYMKNNKDAILSAGKQGYFQDFMDLQQYAASHNLDQKNASERIEQILSFCKTAGYSRGKLYQEQLIEQKEQEYHNCDFGKTTGETKIENPAKSDTEEEIPVTLSVEMEETSEQSVDCFQTIMEYAGYEDKDIEKIRVQIQSYRDLVDVYSTEDSVRLLRRDLTTLFFDVYEKAFFRSVSQEEPLDEILKMFFFFGFMDVQLVGEENANLIYELTEHIYLCNSAHVYTIYNWLVAIYEGKKEPSRNAFDLDYPAYLREQFKTAKINKAQLEEMTDSREEKVRFEIRNMFETVNRATYGRITTYCALIREEELIKSAEDMLVTSAKLEEAMNQIRQIDYTCFYHTAYQTQYKDKSVSLNFKKEVLPDIILMPNCGNKGMMWQECANAKRDTPGRFMFPIFTVANIEDLLIECCGRYRWEICRKIQGMRWNDIRERSLTSEYCDYIQFYKKNRNLSADAKEKIRNSLVKSKNNFREVFVRDYVTWLKYEAKGSIRLNKISREIMFRYCPFSRQKRRVLVDSPLFRDLILRFEVTNAEEKKRMKNLLTKYEKDESKLPEELKSFLGYFDL